MSLASQLPVAYCELSADETYKKQHYYVAKNNFEQILGERVIHIPLSSDRPIKPHLYDTDDVRASSQDPRALFESQLAVSGALVQFENSICDEVSYKVLRNKRTIVLTPLFFNNSLSLQFHRLVFKLPDDVLKDGVSSVKLNGTAFMMDILTEKGLFITLNIDLSNFTQEAPLSAETFFKWGHVTMPYSIDYRQPHYLKTLSENLSIIAFKDGGLLQMTRDSKFGQIDTTLFTDSSYFNSFTRFFKRKQEEDFVDNDTSIRAVISSVKLNEEYLMTLSIDRKLRVWSLESNATVYEQTLMSNIADTVYLNSNPAELISVIDYPSAKELRLATLLPLKGHQKIIIWNLAISENNVLLQEVASIDTPKVGDSNNWIAQTYHVCATDNSNLKISLLYRSNLLAKVVVAEYNLDTNEFSWSATKSSKLEESSTSVSGIHFADSLNEHYIAALTNNYSKTILETVLRIFESHYNHISSKKSLVDKILDIVQLDLDPESLHHVKDLKNQWLKFEGSCKELTRQSCEPIDLSYHPTLDMIYLSKSLGESVYKKSAFIESLFYSRQHCAQEIEPSIPFRGGSINAQNLSELVTLALDFKRVFNDEAIEQLGVRIVQSEFQSGDDNLEKMMSSIFDDIMSPGLTDDLINQLLTRLSSISNVLDVVDYMANNSGADFERFVSGKFSAMGSTLFSAAFRNVNFLYKDFTLGLAMIMLIIDSDSQVVSFFQKLCSNFQKLRLNEIVCDMWDEDLLSEIINEKFNVSGFKVVSSDTLNNVISSALTYTLRSDSFLLRALSHLISKNKADVVLKSEIVNFLSSENPIHVFLLAIVYLSYDQSSKAYKLMIDNATLVIDKTLTEAENDDLAKLEDLRAIFGSKSLVKFYSTATSLFMDKNYIEKAYSLAKLALKSNQEEETDDSDLIYWNVFQLSVKLSDYNISFASIQKLSSELRLKSLRIFILHLLETKSISVLLDYNFKDQISDVDAIILELAKQQDFINNSLQFYKILYTLRLSIGDKRGAAEALYQFICEYDSPRKIQIAAQKWELEAEVRALFVTLLNAIKTIEDSNDQWIVKSTEVDEKRVMFYKELQREFKAKFQNR